MEKERDLSTVVSLRIPLWLWAPIARCLEEHRITMSRLLAAGLANSLNELGEMELAAMVQDCPSIGANTPTKWRVTEQKK